MVWSAIMTIFAMGFLFIMVFTLLVGVGAMVFISFDSAPSSNQALAKKNATTRLFEAVRRINTTTIQTVDKAGAVQEWTRSK
jgi:uncharacterized membrane protein